METVQEPTAEAPRRDVMKKHRKTVLKRARSKRPPEPLRDSATEHIRNLILAGERGFRSGEILSENQLATRLKLTRTPIRNALNQLANEGIVTIIPRVGTQVRVVRPEEAKAIMGLRYAIETIVIGELIDARPNLQPVQAILKQMETIAASVKLEPERKTEFSIEFVKADMELHAKMAELADGYSAAVGPLKDLSAQFFLYAYSALQQSDAPTIMDQVNKEHKDILDALGNSDQTKRASAKTFLHDHLENAVERLAPFALSYITSKVPAYFAKG